jgi:Rad3-related DNA helicase
VDLPRSLLIGALIATLGLPPVSVTQDHIQARLDMLFGAGHGYADLVPAMQRVVQAAGRVLRTPEVRGWLWLLDDRYRSAEIIELLPPWWHLPGPTPNRVVRHADQSVPLPKVATKSSTKRALPVNVRATVCHPPSSMVT